MLAGLGAIALTGSSKPSPVRPRLTTDPIRFTMQADKRQLAPNETVELTITAELMDISPKLMFFLPGANAYTLKLLLPTGFRQTGGDNLTESVSAELTYPTRQKMTYHVTGHFTAPTESACFRLLRGPGQTNDQTLFVDKGRLCISVSGEQNGQGAARLNSTQAVSGVTDVSCVVGSPQGTFDGTNCDGIWGWALDQSNLNQPVLVDIYVDGVKTYAGITANADRPDLVAAFGNNPAARYHGYFFSPPANASWRNGQTHTMSVRICGTNTDLYSPKTVSGCTGGTTAPTPSLAISPGGSQNVPASAGSLPVAVTASNVTWTASSSTSWLTVSPASGSGNATVTLTYLANTASTPRSATVSFSGSGVTTQTVIVTQASSLTSSTQVEFYRNITGSGFGFSTGSGDNAGNRADVAAALAGPNPGFDGVRLFVDWAGLEPTPGNYDFATLDADIQYVVSKGGKVAICFKPERYMYNHIPGQFFGNDEWRVDNQGRNCNAGQYAKPSIFSNNVRTRLADLYAALFQHLAQSWPTQVKRVYLGLGESEEFYMDGFINENASPPNNNYLTDGDYNPTHVLPKWQQYLLDTYGPTTPFTFGGTNQSAQMGMVYPRGGSAETGPKSSTVPNQMQIMWDIIQSCPERDAWNTFIGKRGLYDFYKIFVDKARQYAPNLKVSYYIADLMGDQNVGFKKVSQSLLPALAISDGLYDTSVGLPNEHFNLWKSVDIMRGTYGQGKTIECEFDVIDLGSDPSPYTTKPIDQPLCEQSITKWIGRSGGGNLVFHFSQAMSPACMGQVVSALRNVRAATVNNPNWSPISRANLPTVRVSMSGLLSNGNGLDNAWKDAGGNNQPINVVLEP